MKKITFIILFVSTTLFISCSSNEDSSVENPTKTPEVIDPRLPNQKLFRPAVKLFPKKENLKSITKLTAATISQDILGNEVKNDISEINYSYDSKGRLNSIDKKSNFIDFFTAATFHYNNSDELINATNPNEVVEINSKGYIMKISSQYGKMLNLDYDEIGRLIKQEGVYAYSQLLLTYNSNDNYETHYGITETKTTYNYVGDKIFVETIDNQKDFITVTRTDNGIIKDIKDRITKTSFEITVDYNKAGIYSSEPIFRDNFINWLHLKEWKIKTEIDGGAKFDYKYDFDYNYDKDGYLTALTQTLTNTYGGKQTIRRLNFTYE